MSAPSCIFCKIIEGAIPCHKVAETAKAFAFMDINPLARGHVLVIPKQHAAALHEVELDAAAEVGRMVAQISRVVAGVDGAGQYNVLQNNGRLAHQEVPHVHFHVIPKRDAATGLKLEWDVLSLPPDAIAEDARQYRDALAKQ